MVSYNVMVKICKCECSHFASLQWQWEHGVWLSAPQQKPPLSVRQKDDVHWKRIPFLVALTSITSLWPLSPLLHISAVTSIHVSVLTCASWGSVLCLCPISFHNIFLTGFPIWFLCICKLCVDAPYRECESKVKICIPPPPFIGITWCHFKWWLNVWHFWQVIVLMCCIRWLKRLFAYRSMPLLF